MMMTTTMINKMRCVPDDLKHAVGNNEHLSSYFALATDEISRREDVSSHLQHEVVQKFRLALVKYCHLSTQALICIY